MSIDFCCACGCWISADAGIMRLSKTTNEPEIICNECHSLERSVPIVACQSKQKHDVNNGTLSENFINGA